MNSDELRDKLILKNIHTYVCAKDQLSNITTCDFAVICNNEYSFEKGQHWLAFYKSKHQKYVDFFDSFGLPIEFYGKEFNTFIEYHGGFVRYNNKQLQSNNSNYCGEYCLYFLFKRNSGILFGNIFKSFSSNNKTNDKIVNSFVIDLTATHVDMHINDHNSVSCSCKNYCKYHNMLSNFNYQISLYLYVDI